MSCTMLRNGIGTWLRATQGLQISGDRSSANKEDAISQVFSSEQRSLTHGLLAQVHDACLSKGRQASALHQPVILRAFPHLDIQFAVRNSFSHPGRFVGGVNQPIQGLHQPVVLGACRDVYQHIALDGELEKKYQDTMREVEL